MSSVFSRVVVAVVLCVCPAFLGGGGGGSGREEESEEEEEEEGGSKRSAASLSLPWRQGDKPGL